MSTAERTRPSRLHSAMTRPHAGIRTAGRARSVASEPARRPYDLPFRQALTALEEMTAGERPVAGRFTLNNLVDRLESTAGGAAPVRVRRAAVVTPTELHDALLDWQDALEVRDGREPERRQCAPKVHERWTFTGRLQSSLPVESRLYRQRRRAAAA
jgi:hypothetical protein